MNQIMNRLAATTVGIMLALTSLGVALAQDTFPTKPIKIVVPYAAGGVADTFSRAVGQHLQQALGQPVIVDNKAGGSQMIGAMDVVHAPADGYTLFLGASTSLAVNVYTQKGIRYDPVKDFTPVSLGMRMPLFLVVNPAVPARSVRELIALLKASPNKYTYASIGPGSSTHMAGERFMLQTGTKMVHVPYKSSMGAITDVMAGHVDINFDVGSTSLPLIRDGKLRALGVGGRQRVSAMPDLPTIAEAGVPGYEATVWFAFVMRAGTPQPIVDKLSREINRILRLPEMEAKFAPLAIELAPSTPQELGDLIKSEIVYWAKTLKDAGIKPE